MARELPTGWTVQRPDGRCIAHTEGGHIGWSAPHDPRVMTTPDKAEAESWLGESDQTVVWIGPRWEDPA